MHFYDTNAGLICSINAIKGLDEITEEEYNIKKEFFQNEDEIVRKQEEKHRPLTESEVFTLFTKQQINTLSVDDDTSLRMKSYYPKWQELTEQQFTAEKSGYKFTYGEDLYKTINPKQEFLENWIPGQGTESIFERIDETHDGTKEDPIPFKTNMEVFKDKYYIEDGILYICIEGSKQPLQNKASELPRYFKVVVEE